MYRPPDLDWLNALKTKADSGADFATLARDNSEATTAGAGRRPRLGRQGPARRAQQEQGIFGTAVGSTSTVVVVPGDGIYLFKVLAEETRTPEGTQLDTIKSSAFSNWYTAKKDAATITRDPTLSGSTGG